MFINRLSSVKVSFCSLTSVIQVRLNAFMSISVEHRNRNQVDSVVGVRHVGQKEKVGRCQRSKCRSQWLPQTHQYMQINVFLTFTMRGLGSETKQGVLGDYFHQKIQTWKFIRKNTCLCFYLKKKKMGQASETTGPVCRPASLQVNHKWANCCFTKWDGVKEWKQWDGSSSSFWVPWDERGDKKIK